MAVSADPLIEAARDPSPIVPAIAVRGVSHAYGAGKVLNDISLSVPTSRFIPLPGLNGAGKDHVILADYAALRHCVTNTNRQTAHGDAGWYTGACRHHPVNRGDDEVAI
ncbi:MAG TPA: hypothetical protein VMB73_08255 [Acetobacteraceae bacterium]|jgi:ABC-type molybdenum transport system ATPase subunit/photorepair protein PhrA|nr:hypothetical protein [Acetobacteraceae bacterium]